MARLRYNGLATGSAGSLADLTLSGSHTNSTTTLTFNAALTYANGTAVPTLSGGDYFFLSIVDSGGRVAEIVKVTGYTTAGTSATVVRGQEGTTGVAHASGAKVYHAGVAGDFGLKDFAKVSLTSGDIILTSTTPIAVSSSLDISLVADAGDVIEYGLSGLLSAVGQTVCLDLYTMVSGSPVNSFGPGLSTSNASQLGAPGWFTSNAYTQSTPVSGPVARTLNSSDISGGIVSLRLMFAKSNTTGRTIFANANCPLDVWAKNYGPASY